MSDTQKLHWTNGHQRAARTVPEPRTRIALEAQKTYRQVLDSTEEPSGPPARKSKDGWTI